jgi:subtilisin family serine protease
MRIHLELSSVKAELGTGLLLAIAALGLSVMALAPANVEPRSFQDFSIVGTTRPNFGVRAEYVVGPRPALKASPQALPYQYVREKLRLDAVHALARGTGIAIAIIDSEIDGTHPEIRGAVGDRYDATGAEGDPHPHGTGIAGAIVARGRLMGVAPGAHILGARAFWGHAGASETTTHNIIKALDWAVRNNVRIINMSFAGPRDPALEHALKAADNRGVVLVAAVGNAGPNAPPLFPAAHPHVIAVTATDAQNRLFADANHGRHVALAAPGVDIVAPAPAGAYQEVTGTSIAAAHVSGVVALMLERNPALSPAAVRKILTASATPLGPADQYGAGLIDPMAALDAAPSTM